jgi:hypothetical protein
MPRERRWLLGLVTITACSWARLILTGSPKVDENRPSEAAATVLFAALVVGYGLMVSAWREMLAAPPEKPRRLAYAGLTVASLMLPMISNDVFSLFVYGSVAGAGHDVYTTAAWLSSSPFYGWLGQMWSQTVCVYGPTTLMATLPARLANGNVWLALLLLRAAWLVPTVLVLELSLRQLRDRPAFHTMLWLNPLWIVEGPGQLHTDMLGVLAVTAGILAQRRGSTLRGYALFAVAAVGKYSFLFAGPWFWLTGARTTRERLLRVPVLALVVLAVGAVSFAPFWHGPETLTEPVRALASMNPGGSIVEVVGRVVDILRGNAVAPVDLPAKAAVAFERSSKADVWLVLSLVTRALFVVVALRSLYLMWTGKRGIALGTGCIVVAAITLFSHRFQSWYLLAALPFFALECPPAWQRWWIAVVAVAVSVAFIEVLPRTAWLLPVWGVVSNACVVVLFLYAPRARYWWSTPPGPASSPVADRAPAS